jgi:cysteine desulfurase
MRNPAVYLDYNATSPVDSRVLKKLGEAALITYGNASSHDHTFGWDAAAAVEDARMHVANLVNARAHEIVFTSGATESINWACKGYMHAPPGRRLTMVTSVTEHAAVLESCRQLHRCWGAEVILVPVDKRGAIDAGRVRSHRETCGRTLLSLMLANNEIGTLQRLSRFAEIARASGAFLFSDMTQAVGKVAVDVHAEGIDLAAFSAHKLCGPKGIGALFIRDGEPAIKLEPLMAGAGQERGLRAGTLNIPAIVGFGEACRIAYLEMSEESVRIGRLRDKLESALLAELPDIWINGDRENRLPNTTNIGFRGVDARTLIRDMHDIAVSTKSACSSGDPGPSHVLKAIGLSDDEAYSCIRFSLGRFTTEQEIDYTIEKVIGSVRKLRRNASACGG